MRFLSSAACLVLALSCSRLMAASVDAAYVVGNLKDLSAGNSGLLRVESEDLTFRSGKVTIAALYKKITGYEMGPAVVRPANGPVWKRLTTKRPAHRNLTIDFTDARGEEQTMTLELPELAASEVYDAIEIGTGHRRAGSTSQPWWGDNMWRTTRNNRDWNSSAPPPAAASPKPAN